MMGPPSYIEGGTFHAGVHDHNPACDVYPPCTPYEPVVKTPDPWKASGAYDPPPAHYDTGVMDPWAVWAAFGLDPWEANLVKYICRAGKKDGEPRLKDLLKARNYLAYLIEREQAKDTE